MASHSKPKRIGILTSGGDCPGLNAAIRGVVKAALGEHGITCIGILDGFRGLVENRTIPLDDRAVSGILTLGGTFLGTSREKPHKMLVGHEVKDMTSVAIANAKSLKLDGLVCLGGAGTAKNANRLREAGLPVLCLPKTIDNDIRGTDITFGYDTALGIATEAIDRLHTTATSHQRIIVVEIMGHKAGWLALGAGIAGGADVILLPEIPYDEQKVADHLLERARHSKRFSIIAVAEGAMTKAEAKAADEERLMIKADKKRRKNAPEEVEDPLAKTETVVIKRKHEAPIEATVPTIQEPRANRLARNLQRLTGIEARVTCLGHVQRGGTPSAADRLLCTRLGTTTTQLLAEGRWNHLVAVRGDQIVPVPLEDVAGKLKLVPVDHPSITAARLVGTCLGD